MPDLTLADLLQRVATNLQDVDTSTGLPAYDHWKQAALTNWLNDAITRVCLEVPLRKYTVFTAAPNPVLASNPTAEFVPALGEELAELGSLKFDNLSPLERRSIDELGEMYPDWDTLGGSPLWFCYGEWAPGIVKLVPDPGYAPTIGLRGMATVKPALMSADGDVPPFDSDFHQLCEHYATARAWKMDGETQDLVKAEAAMQEYRELLASYKGQQERSSTMQGAYIPADYL